MLSSWFFGKKNTSFCKNVEKKIESNKYYYPEKIQGKDGYDTEELSDDEYDFERKIAQNPLIGYSWTSPEDGIKYRDDEAYNQEASYNKKIEIRKMISSVLFSQANISNNSVNSSI